MSTFSSRLKHLRAIDNVSQKDVANFLGMTPNAYQKYEYGTREPNYEVLIKIANYFKVPSDYLLGIGIFSQWEYIMEHIDELKSIIKTTVNESLIKDGTADDFIELQFSPENENSNADALELTLKELCGAKIIRHDGVENTTADQAPKSFIATMLNTTVVEILDTLSEKSLMVFFSSIVERIEISSDVVKIYWR